MLFRSNRSGLAIHPDGGAAPWTEGCIGIQDYNTKHWYDAIRKFTKKNKEIDVSVE